MWGAAYVEVSPLAELATGSGEGSERRHSLSHLTVPILLTFKRDPVRSSPHTPPHTVQGEYGNVSQSCAPKRLPPQPGS